MNDAQPENHAKPTYDQLEAAGKEYVDLVDDIEKVLKSSLNDGLQLRTIYELVKDFRL